MPRFEDSAGGGWFVDVSEAFEDEAMYAVVRSVGGVRTVIQIVEEEEAFRLAKGARGSEPPEPAEEPLDENDSAEEVMVATIASMALEQQRDTARNERDALRVEVEKFKPKPKDPALIRIYQSNDDKENWSTYIVNFGAVGEEIRRLMNEHHTAPECIEVWTRRQVPKVKVELE